MRRGGTRLVALACGLVLGAAVLLGASGCDSYDRFRTGPERTFRGAVLGEGEGSFIRRGFAAGTTLELSFDPSAIGRPEVGTITTLAPDGAVLFDATPLESIAPLSHDLLSELTFPGAGRLETFLLLAHPTSGALAGREVMVFLSLLDTGEIEIRVIAGTGDEARGDVFGVFRLSAVTP
ncbi:MAG: hypothetical protein K1X94_17425 [Sandaracinaceae bacterium]|nr:hypothetical protein [Sandaracinaceae bacterium]